MINSYFSDTEAVEACICRLNVMWCDDGNKSLKSVTRSRHNFSWSAHLLCRGKCTLFACMRLIVWAYLWTCVVWSGSVESCLKRVKFDLTLSSTYLGVITGYVMSLVPVSFIRQVRTRFSILVCKHTRWATLSDDSAGKNTTVNSSQRRQTPWSTRHTILWCDELTGSP